jgi:hypothetical protein
MKKKVTIPKVVAIFKREIFLNIGKKVEQSSYQECREKRPLVYKLNFFFLPHYGNANY